MFSLTSCTVEKPRRVQVYLMIQHTVLSIYPIYLRLYPPETARAPDTCRSETSTTLAPIRRVSGLGAAMR